MPGKVRSSLPPQIALLELGQALEYALQNPTADERGTLLFGVEKVGSRDPISRFGCPKPTGGFWTLPDLAELAGLVKKYARDLGGRAGAR